MPGRTITSVRSAAGCGAAMATLPIGMPESPIVIQPARARAASALARRMAKFTALSPAAPISGGFLRRSVGDEAQRDAVVAVAQAGGLRPVVEYVAVMAAAAHAVVLGALHEELAVDRGAEHARDGREEARPAGAAVELHRGGEKRQSAPGTGEYARALLAVERTRAGALGALVAQHVVSRRRQAFLPFGVGQLERFGAGRDIGSLCEQGFPVLLQFFHFYDSFRPRLCAREPRQTQERQRYQTLQPVATLHVGDLQGRQV